MEDSLAPDAGVGFGEEGKTIEDKEKNEDVSAIKDRNEITDTSQSNTNRRNREQRDVTRDKDVVGGIRKKRHACRISLWSNPEAADTKPYCNICHRRTLLCKHMSQDANHARVAQERAKMTSINGDKSNVLPYCTVCHRRTMDCKHMARKRNQSKDVGASAKTSTAGSSGDESRDGVYDGIYEAVDHGADDA